MTFSFFGSVLCGVITKPKAMQDVFLIPVSKEELKEIIKDCVSDVLNKQLTIPKEDADKLISIKEASEFLNLAPQTLYGFTSQNKIPFIKKGKKLYFNKIELISWLNDNK